MATEAVANEFDGMSAIDIAVAAADENVEEPSGIPGSCAAETSTEGLITFSQFQFVEMKGRPLHGSYLPLQGEPVLGIAMAKAMLWGPWREAQFQFVNASGELIDGADLTAPDPELSSLYFYGEVTVPNIPFFASVTGTDINGIPFTITCSHEFLPQTIEVRFDLEFQKVSVGSTELTVTLINHGPADNFSVVSTNNMELPISVSDSQIDLGEGESKQIAVSLSIPSFSSGVLDVSLKLTASSTSNSSVENFGSSVARIERYNFMFMDGFDTVNLNGTQP